MNLNPTVARALLCVNYMPLRLSVRVIPRASKNELLGPFADGSYKARLTSPPVDGKANEALIKLLSGHFNVPKSKIKIVKGMTSKKKLVEMHDAQHK